MPDQHLCFWYSDWSLPVSGSVKPDNRKKSWPRLVVQASVQAEAPPWCFLLILCERERAGLNLQTNTNTSQLRLKPHPSGSLCQSYSRSWFTVFTWISCVFFPCAVRGPRAWGGGGHDGSVHREAAAGGLQRPLQGLYQVRLQGF